MRPTTVISDVEYKCDGKVLAIKPYTAHPDDAHLWLVLVHRPAAHQPYVTWLWNAQAEGLVHGHYFADLKEALADFGARIGGVQ